jgi:formamidopyrimidine-DNA glycosylase
MPEGPECTRTAKQVNRYVKGLTLVNVNIISGRYTKKLPDGFDELMSFLPLKVNEVTVKGKFIYWLLDKEASIWTTLGMTGNFKLQPSKHTRLAYYFDDGSAVYYNDQRNFGTTKFCFNSHSLLAKLDKIGPDMLNNPCTLEEFKLRASKKPKWSVVKWLMDQSQISGVGNIYKSESLFLAGISPYRIMESLTTNEMEKLYNAICKILQSAYRDGGATIRNYSDLYDNHGKYTAFPSNIESILEARWDNKVMCYGRKEDIYGNPIQKVTLDDQRTTFWSPIVQT